MSAILKRARTGVLDIAYEESGPSEGLPIALHGEANGVGPPEMSEKHARFFTGSYRRRVIPRAGHNLPQEVPGVVTEAALEVIGATR